MLNQSSKHIRDGGENMAMYVGVPRDLGKVKSKVFMNLTKRQITWFLVGVLLGVPLFFILKEVTTISLAVLGMMVLMMPFFFLAIYEKNGQSLEVILKQFIQANFVEPKIRIYQIKNLFEANIKETGKVVKGEKQASRKGREEQSKRRKKQTKSHK